MERDRLLCSAEFVRSPTMSRLLRFLVDHKLQENRTPLTAYTVAVEGFGRVAGFDTQIDSYPRVQIGRLRRMLDQFYLREKSEQRLSIPFQNYEIILAGNKRVREPEPLPIESELSAGESASALIAPDTATTDRHNRLQAVARGPVLVVLAALMLLAIGAIYYLQQTDGPTTAATAITYPAVIVKGGEGRAGSSSPVTLAMIQSHLVVSLARFDQIRIFGADAEPTNPSQYLLEASILNGAGDRARLRLVDSMTGEVIWSSRIEMASSEAGKADLDRAVIDIAGPYGKIAQHELSKHRSDYTAGYPCLLQFHQYMRVADRALLDPVLRCMRGSAEQFPDDSYLMSMLAIAKNISEKLDLPDAIDGSREEFAVRAAKLDNDSASATFAVAQNAFFEGDCRKGVSYGERAVGLNPLSSRIIGYLGMYMLACDMPAGEDYANRALAMDANADLTVVATVAMAKLRRGEAKAAQELSLQYLESVPGAAPGLEISFILSSAMLGEKERARKAWRLLAKRSGFPETAEPRDVLGRWIANPAIIRNLEADFRKAGLY